MSKRKLIILLTLFSILFFHIPASFANPIPHSIASGHAEIHQDNHTMVVQQHSEKAILNWHSFNIDAHETTHFQQPPGGITLNRINPAQGVSNIRGRLTSTGQIILVNGAGLYFHKGAMVNVGGIIASTSNISNDNFQANKYIFDQPHVNPGNITNRGHIKAADHGLVALVGHRVKNYGVIEANVGTVALASGNKMTLNFDGSQLIHFTLDEPAFNVNQPQAKRGVKHTGKIIADAGQIFVSTGVAKHVLDNVINMQGVAQARSVHQRNGVIIISGDTVQISGRLDTSSRQRVSAKQRLQLANRGTPNNKRGHIEVIGNNVHIETDKIDASGHKGGGTILIGGYPEGSETRTRISTNTRLHADALESGNGGNIVVRSTESTQAHGTMSAQGGPLQGNGGNIETASMHHLDINDLRIDLTAPSGEVGTWKLGAQDITLEDKALADSIDATNPWQPTNIDTNTIQNNLAKANVIIEGKPGEYSFGDILVTSNITWNTATNLTISSYHNIELISTELTNTAGGNLTLIADNTKTGSGIINKLNDSIVELSDSDSDWDVVSHSGDKTKDSWVHVSEHKDDDWAELSHLSEVNYYPGSNDPLVNSGEADAFLMRDDLFDVDQMASPVNIDLDTPLFHSLALNHIEAQLENSVMATPRAVMLSDAVENPATSEPAPVYQPSFSKHKAASHRPHEFFNLHRYADHIQHLEMREEEEEL